MIGRCQQALYRGVLVALQQQNACLQLDACLGHQAVRGKSRYSRYHLPSKVRDSRRKEHVLLKLKEQSLLESGAPDIFVTPEAALPLSVEDSSSSSSSSKNDSSKPVKSPLSAQTPGGGSSSIDPLSQMDIQAAPRPPPGGQQGQQKGSMSSWFKNLMGLQSKRAVSRLKDHTAPAGSVSPLQDAAPAGTAAAAAAEANGQASPDDDAWDELTRFRNMSLDEYHNMIKNDPAAEDFEAPPRPMALIRGRNVDSRQFMDRSRVIHLRLEQQSALIQLMDPQDKLKVKQDPEGAVKNTQFLQLIARKTNIAVDTVRETFASYHRRREMVQLLADYRDGGHELPLQSEEAKRHQLVVKLKQDKQQRDFLQQIQGKRDPKNCKLLVWAKVVGGSTQCRRTGVPYSLCCGALSAKQRFNALAAAHKQQLQLTT